MQRQYYPLTMKPFDVVTQSLQTLFAIGNEYVPLMPSVWAWDLDVSFILSKDKNELWQTRMESK